jgi:hypothetical protein
LLVCLSQPKKRAARTSCASFPIREPNEFFLVVQRADTLCVLSLWRAIFAQFDFSVHIERETEQFSGSYIILPSPTSLLLLLASAGVAEKGGQS